MPAKPLIAAACLSCAVSAGEAAEVLVTNPGFETIPAALGGPIPENTFVQADIPGWSVFVPPGSSNDPGDFFGLINPTNSTFFPAGAPEGDLAAIVFLDDGDNNEPLGLRQVLGATLQASTRYTLQVDVGNIASGTGSASSTSQAFFDLDGFPGYRVELLAGGQVIAADDNTLLPAEGQFETSTVAVTIGGSNALLGSPLEIRLINLDIPGTLDAPGIEVDFDNVRLDATVVPLPGTLALAVSAFAALLFGRRLSA